MTVFDLLAQSPPIFIGVVLILGLLVGSFLNVVIYRVPVMLERQWREQCAEINASPPLSSSPGASSVATSPNSTAGSGPGAGAPARPPEAPFNLVVPRSACRNCKAPITALQNIPVLSYLFLKGRCARCGDPISIRYPIIEAVTGALSAAVAWKFGFGLPACAALVLTWYLVALTFIDVDTQLLPDSLTLPLMWMGLWLSLWGPVGEAPVPVDIHSSVVGAIAGYLSLWSVYHLFKLLTGKEGMGYGDFKLFAALGAWLGWTMLIPIILIAAIVGAVVGVILLASKGQSRGTPIAFGPFLAASGWLMLMFGHRLVTGYLGMFAPHP